MKIQQFKNRRSIYLPSILITAFLCLSFTQTLVAEEAKRNTRSEQGVLKPLMIQKGEVYLKDDFSDPAKVKIQAPAPRDKSVKSNAEVATNIWAGGQESQVSVKDGILFVGPSSEEAQERRKNDDVKGHNGTRPILGLAFDFPNICFEFKVLFTGEETDPTNPKMGMGGHSTGVVLGKDGSGLFIDHDALVCNKAADFTYKSGKWYHCLVEIKGDEVVFQVKDGPTFYAKHKSVALVDLVPRKQRLSFSGIHGGDVRLDDVTIWRVKDEVQDGWSEKQKDLAANYKAEPTSRHDKIKSKSDKKKKKKGKKK